MLGFGGMILATTIDVICVNLDVRPDTMAISMSAYTNGRRLFSMRKKKGHIQCLYGIRALALIWLIYGYRHFLSLLLPLINPLDFVLIVSRPYRHSSCCVACAGSKCILSLSVCSGILFAMGY